MVPFYVGIHPYKWSGHKLLTRVFFFLSCIAFMDLIFLIMCIVLFSVSLSRSLKKVRGAETLMNSKYI